MIFNEIVHGGFGQLLTLHFYCSNLSFYNQDLVKLIVRPRL